MGALLALTVSGGAVGLAATRHASLSTKPTNGGTLTTAFTSNIETLDPGQWTDVTSMYPMQEIYSTLVGYDKNSSKIVPEAATWTVDPSGKVYTFTIRPGVVFSNGDPMTAEDVVASLNRVTSCNASGSGPAPYGFAYAGIEGYQQWAGECNKQNQPPAGVTGLSGLKILAPNKVQITLTSPQPYFLNTLALMSAAILDHNTIGKNGSYDELHAVGSGPYMLQSWNQGHEMVLVKNPKWWGPKYGLPAPRVDKLVFKENITASTQLLQFEKGQLDFLWGPLPSATYLQVLASRNLQALYHRVTENGIVYLAFNSKRGPFSTPDAYLLRQAVNYAIDKQQIVRNITNGRAQIASEPLPPGIPGYAGLKPYPYNVAKAKQLIKEWAQKDHQKLPLTVTMIYLSNTPDHIALADLVQQDLKQIGITVKLVGKAEAGSYWPYEDNASNPWDIAWTDWFQDYPDAEDFEYNLLSKAAFNATNVGDFYNATFEKLIDEADNLPASQEAKRVQLYQQAEKIAHDQAAWAFLYYMWNDAVIQPWVGPNDIYVYLHPVKTPQFEYMWTNHK
jgi:peptide/nickel transport system substrate-binding protein